MAKIGSAATGQIRTCWNLTVTVGIPFSRWGAEPFIVKPFLFPRAVAVKTCISETMERTNKQPGTHPFHLALRWRRQLGADDQLTQARIAVREGISRARVTQILNLLQLPDMVQEVLRRPAPPHRIEDFNERRLRALLSCGDDKTQLRQWDQWLEELRNASGE